MRPQYIHIKTHVTFYLLILILQTTAARHRGISSLITAFRVATTKRRIKDLHLKCVCSLAYHSGVL